MTRISLFFMASVLLLLLGSGKALAHAGNLDQAPWHACEGLSLGTGCSFENAAQDVHRGTCRGVADTLLCVRNRPIEHATPGGAESAHMPEVTPSASGSAGFFVLAALALLNVPLVLKRFTRRAVG